LSFQEVAITVACYNEASEEFYRISNDAAAMGTKVKASAESMGGSFKDVSRDLTTLGTGVSAIARLGEQFGLLDEASASAMRTMGMSITAISAVIRVIDILRSSEIVATAVTWAYNASLAAKITLLTFGAGAIIVAAAAMAALAMQTRAATSAVKDYNAAAAETPRYSRSIRRAGEERDLLRRGIE
jgi:hypothetical protein